MPTPTITSLSPASALAGGVQFTLTVNGTGFSSDVVVGWGSTALATTYVSATEATATVPASLIALPGGAFITVTTGGNTSVSLLFPVTTVYDLCTLSQVKSWLSANGTPSNQTTDDINIQIVISAAGTEWLWRTGRSNADQSLPPTSPLVEPTSFNEWYDGNGANRMFLRQTPIQTVSLLSINGQAIPQSSVFGAPGWVIHQDRKSLVIRSGGGASSGTYTTAGWWGTPWYFIQNRAAPQNINVQYTAGFAAEPVDIELACIQMVAIGIKRRAWIDQQSQTMAQGAGTIRFRDWEFPPEVLRVMKAYTRTAVV
jgi:hypothetical protein